MKLSPILLMTFGMCLALSFSSFAGHISDKDPLKLLAFLEKDPSMLLADSASSASYLSGQASVRLRQKEVLNIEVDGIKKVSENLMAMAASYGAIKTSEFGQTSPELFMLSFRVPTEQLKSFLSATENLATLVIDQGTGSTDVGSELNEIETRLSAKANARTQMLAFYSKTKNATEKQSIQRAMLQWEEENAALLARKQYWEDQLKYAIVEITLTPVTVVEGAGNVDDNTFSGALKSGLYNTSELLKAALRYWPLVLAGLGLIVFLIISSARNRRRAESRHRDMMFLLQAQQNKF